MCILQNEAIPFQFGDISDWSFESGLRNPSTNVSIDDDDDDDNE